MSDTDKGDDSEGAGQRGKTLSLKRTVESGQVRQSFSHGRSKSVLVEKRRKRMIKPGAAGEDQATMEEASAASSAAPTVAPAAAPVENKIPDGLSKAEHDKRMAAVADAKVRAVEEAKQAEINAKARAEEDARLAEECALQEAEEVRRAEALAREKKKADKANPADVAPVASPAAPRREEVKDRPEAAKRPPDRRAGERRRRAGKLTINDALNDEERMRSLASIKRRREREKRQSSSQDASEKVSRVVQLPETITIQELAK